MPDLFRHAQDREKMRDLLVRDPNGPVASMVMNDKPDDAKMLAGIQAMTVLARMVWQRPYDPKLADRLYRIACPTLLIWGADDRLVRPAYGEAYRRHLRKAEFVTIPECGHLPMFEKEAEYTRAILDSCVRAE